MVRYALLLLLVCSVSGCVGVLTSDLQYVQAKSELKTKASVLERFGEPRRKTQDGALEVWHYLLTQRGVSDRALTTQGLSAVFLGILPLWWRSRADENTQFTFRGDDLLSVAELREKGGGFVCGVVLLHGINTTCGTIK